MNLEEETRLGYTISAEMKKVWRVQMELLKKLLSVCEKHNLRIWADGGTLLGTVREHGYIPWDDDIDMAMLREDYDKLVSIAPMEFTSPFFFQCGYTEKVYPIGHAQLRMNGTTAILPYPALKGINQGIFIDIFPYDYIPDDIEERNKLIKKRNQLFTRLQHIKTFDVLHPLRSIVLFPLRYSYHRVYRQFEDIFRENTMLSCNCVCCISFIVDLDHFLRDKKWYNGTVYLPFEDIIMPVPIGYHQILEKQYGDYLVPHQSGSYHGSFWKLDPEKSYTDYLPELNRFYANLLRKRRVIRINRLINKVFH